VIWLIEGVALIELVGNVNIVAISVGGKGLPTGTEAY